MWGAWMCEALGGTRYARICGALMDRHNYVSQMETPNEYA